jgi:hypothetical protein
MRRISIATLASLAGAVTMGVSAAGAAANPVVGHYRSATDSAAAFPDYSWTANHEQVVDLQAWQTQELYALKAANPNITVLMYKNASSVSDSPDSSGRYATGVSYDEANANDWLLRNTSGSPFTFNGYSTLWASDIGSSGYQQAWASNVISELNSAPWDGVLIDDDQMALLRHLRRQVSVGRPVRGRDAEVRAGRRAPDPGRPQAGDREHRILGGLRVGCGPVAAIAQRCGGRDVPEMGFRPR